MTTLTFLYKFIEPSWLIRSEDQRRFRILQPVQRRETAEPSGSNHDSRRTAALQR